MNSKMLVYAFVFLTCVIAIRWVILRPDAPPEPIASAIPVEIVPKKSEVGLRAERDAFFMADVEPTIKKADKLNREAADRDEDAGDTISPAAKAADQAACGESETVSAFAVTATPRQNTWELVRRKDPSPGNDQSMFVPFDLYSIAAFSNTYFAALPSQCKIYTVLKPVVERVECGSLEDQKKFRANLGKYAELYAFLGQIFKLPDVELEQLFQFCRYPLQLVPVPAEDHPHELKRYVEVDTIKLRKSKQNVYPVEKIRPMHIEF